MLRDHTITSALDAGTDSLREQPKPPLVTWKALPALPTGTEEAELKALIDESFAYLADHQRAAVYEGVMRIVSDPQYATSKPQIIAEFRIKAATVRETYRTLDRLSRAASTASCPASSSRSCWRRCAAACSRFPAISTNSSSRSFPPSSRCTTSACLINH